MSAKKPSAADWQVGDEVVVANVNHQARRSVVTKVGRKLVHVAGQPAPFDASEYPCKTQSLYGHVSLWRLDDYQFRCRVEAIGTEARRLVDKIRFGTDRETLASVATELRRALAALGEP